VVLKGAYLKGADTMACYVHDVPGRLRVKTLALKSDPVRALQARSCLEGINGVLETEVSTITGSVVVKYTLAW
jgi:Heavy metal associated domain 2